MRPDQHKKKKNEQYKKKHNIKTDESKKTKGKGGTDTPQTKVRSQTDDVKKGKPHRQQVTQQKASDEQVRTVHYFHKLYM